MMYLYNSCKVLFILQNMACLISTLWLNKTYFFYNFCPWGRIYYVDLLIEAVKSIFKLVCIASYFVVFSVDMFGRHLVILMK